MTIIIRFLTILSLALALPMMAIGTGAAQTRIEASGTLVADLVLRIRNAVEVGPESTQIKDETSAIIDTFFDYDLIARFTAGNAWRTASDSEKQAYKAAFRNVLLSLAAKNFNSLKTLEYESGKITSKGEKLVIVQGKITDKSGKLPDIIINWRVSTKKDQPPRIIDVEIQNISMLITQRQEHVAVINQNGGSFQALIDQLNQQAANIQANEKANN